MNVLVLDFTQKAYKDLGPLIKNQTWHSIWLSSLDVEAVQKIIEDGTVQQVLLVSEGMAFEMEVLSFVGLRYPHVPVTVLQTSEAELEYPSHVVVCWDYHSAFLHIEKTFENFNLVEQHSRRSAPNEMNPILDPRFFSSLDFFQVIDRILSHFATHILCEDIYWVRAEALDEFTHGNQKNLALQLEATFNRSDRFRSLRETEPSLALPSLMNLYRMVKEVSRPQIIEHDRQCHMWLPITDMQICLGYLVFKSIEGTNQRQSWDFIDKSVSLLARYLNFSLQMKASSEAALVDDLTLLYNQRHLAEVLERESARAERYQRKFCVLFMDLDLFKKVNDVNGHLTGSRLLVQVGHLLHRSIRTCDYAFRYGGDEFIVLLVDTDAEKGYLVAERIRSSIEKTHFVVDGKSLNLTVSVGLACYPDHAQTSREIIQLADQAMYYGKNKRRNVVYTAS